MAWRVYEFRERDRPRALAILGRDPIGRASAQVRDARHFGWERDTFFVVLEGLDETLRVADAQLLSFGRVPGNAEALYRHVRAEDDAAAAGLGAVMAQLPPPEFKPTTEERRREALQQAQVTARTLWQTLQDRWRAWRERPPKRA